MCPQKVFLIFGFGVLYFESLIPEAVFGGCISGGSLTQPCSLLSVSGGSFPPRAGTPFHSHGRFVTHTRPKKKKKKKEKLPQMMCFRDLPLKIKFKHRLFHLGRFQPGQDFHWLNLMSLPKGPTYTNPFGSLNLFLHPNVLFKSA